MTLVLLCALALSAAPAADVADARTDALFAALQRSDFDGAATHFDATMKAALSPAKLGTIWQQLGGRMGALRSWKIVERSTARGNDVRLVDLELERGRLRGIVAFDPETHAMTGLHFVPAVAKTEPAPPPAGAPYTAAEVRVGPLSLGGTLLVPKGKGPFPAAVLVQGSGPQDRDETLGPNKPLKDLAEGLAAAGIAVLRYDKRTFAHPEKIDTRRVTVEEETIEDAVAAVALLRKRPEVKAERVFVVGHSLGAVLAPEIASRSVPIGGAVLLAATGRPLPQVVVDQLRYLEAMPPEELAKVDAQAKAVMAGKLADGEEFFHAPAHYWTDLASRDPAAFAKKLGKPILYMRGERDYQVNADDEKLWRGWLAGVPGAAVETFPGLNHLFISGSGKPGPKEYETPGHVDPAVISRIAKLVKGS